MKQNKRLLALLLALMLVFTLAACGGGADQETGDPEDQPDQPEDSVPVSSLMSDFSELIAEKKEQNEDTVGWLWVPGLPIDDVVVFNAEDNQYYRRLNFEKQPDYNGVFYADRRTQFGEFTSDTLGNLCIYGHALTDEVEHENYEIKFGSLHDFRNEELARELPYIMFSTEEENMVYEVFAVFYANSDNTDFAYNAGGAMTQEEYYNMVVEQALPRSLYNYEDVELKPDDKFIALSACLYSLPDETDYLPYDGAVQTGYPNTFYRYVIMGRLIDPETPLIKEVNLTVNEGFLADPDGYWAA